MPKTREKLIELIEQTYYCSIEELADHLIANGATVQEWISVKDRLPEDDSDVLAYLQIGEESRIYPANYAKGMWFDYIFNTPATDSTTHWMPLPQPPKGDNADRCVSCGEIIPEGRQVCPNCEKGRGN